MACDGDHCRGGVQKHGLEDRYGKSLEMSKTARGRRMVLMPTAWPAPTGKPIRMSQRRALGSGRTLAAAPAVDSYFYLKQLLGMSGVPGQGAPDFPNTQLHASGRAFES